MNTDLLAETFIEFADTLVASFDVPDFLHLVALRCTDVLEVAATGILLSDRRGILVIAAASSERTQILELLQLSSGEGPCTECFHSGEPVAVPDITDPKAMDRWPNFTHATVHAGYRSVHSLPMRLRGEVIGALNLFGNAHDAPTRDTLRLGQALADMATIGLLQERAVRHDKYLTEQLQHAISTLIHTATKDDPPPAAA